MIGNQFKQIAECRKYKDCALFALATRCIATTHCDVTVGKVAQVIQ